MDEKIKSGLEKVLDSHFDVLFRGELIFPRFKVIGYERISDTTYKARLEFIYLDCININQDYILKNEEAISKPILPIEMVHIINTQVITWSSKEGADNLNLEPDLIDLTEETEELYKWSDPRITDAEIDYALSASGFDKQSISEDDDLKKSLDEFLTSDDEDLKAAKIRLKSFLI